MAGETKQRWSARRTGCTHVATSRAHDTAAGQKKEQSGHDRSKKKRQGTQRQELPLPLPPPPAVHLPRVGGERAVSEHLAARRVFRRMRLSAGSESPSHFPYISSSRPLFGLACALCLVFFFAATVFAVSLPSPSFVSFLSAHTLAVGPQLAEHE